MVTDKRKLSEGWTTLFLLAGMVMSVTWSITSARYVDNLQTIEWAALVGLLAGILLARTRFPTLIAHLFSLVYGTAWISYLGTSLLPSALSPRERLWELSFHINAWLWKVLHGGSSNDSLMFILFLACVVWLLGYVAAWSTLRTYRLWWAILPTATVLLINTYWGPPRLLVFLFAYVGLMLLFFIRFNLFRQQQAWSEARVRYDPEIVWDFLRYGLVLIVIVVTLAWGVPGAAASEKVATFWGEFSEPWERVQDTWNRLFFSSRYYGNAQPNAFGTATMLGGAVHLGDRVIMDVIASAGRYWRAAVYDEYTGQGWLNNDGEMLYLDPFDPSFVVPQFEARRPITQTYISYLPGRTQLFAASQPASIDRPAKVRNSQVPGRLPGDSRPAQLLNTSMIYARTPLESGESYVVVSAVSAADENSLRTAGTDYPSWVTDRYLQLPYSLPQRVIDLAEEITRNAANPYDKAAALEAYLRQIKYNEFIESPPPDQDRVDWFLFDLQEGYCDYYSSAMVVMARAAGIPAREAVGYARGDYDSEVSAYRVRDHHAHAWAEVFFPRFGWVEFEPTAAEAAIVRPRPASDDDGSNSNRRPGGEDLDDLEGLRDFLDDEYYAGLVPPPEPRPWWQTALWILGGLLAMVALIGGGYWWLEEQGLASVGIVRKAYARMTRFGRLLNVLEREPQTPFEYAAELSAEVPAGRRPIHHIAELFVTEQFSPHTANQEESSSAWHELRPNLWRRWFRRLIGRFQVTTEENGESPGSDF